MLEEKILSNDSRTLFAVVMTLDNASFYFTFFPTIKCRFAFVIFTVAQNGASCEASDALLSVSTKMRNRKLPCVQCVFSRAKKFPQQSYIRLETLKVFKCNIYSNLGLVKIAKTLIQSGADVQARDDEGMTSLFTAVLFNGPDMVQFLASSGADVNAPSMKGITPLHVASTDGNIKLIQLLVEGRYFHSRMIF